MDEKIIRLEAREFYENSVLCNAFSESTRKLQELKYRLADFYSPEAKATFLDEIEKIIGEELKIHRDGIHNGNAVEDCKFEIQFEKLAYYINQELGTLPKVARQKYKSNETHERNKVFISYSHFDKDYLKDVQRHFKPFLDQINFWDDTKIQPGQKWKQEIRNEINKTKVAVLLLSTDFLGSEFISTDELPPLLKAAEEDGAVILIVILKPCLFEDFEELNQYQAMNPPNLPISKMDENEKEELLVNLVRQTKRILKG
jgi:hypothetical protein